MPAKQILVPTDFSEHSDAALEQATSIAKDQGASLLIVHVKPPREHFVSRGLTSYPIPFDDTTLERSLNESKPTDSDVGYAQRMLTGDTIDEIVAFAAEEQVEMIVMGTHGRTGLMHLLIGSIAEGVVRRATVPVLTVRTAVDSVVAV